MTSDQVLKAIDDALTAYTGEERELLDKLVDVYGTWQDRLDELELDELEVELDEEGDDSESADDDLDSVIGSVVARPEDD